MNYHPAEQYALDIYDGKILACELVQLSVERYFNDLGRQDTADFPYYHDEEAAQTVINFFSACHHYKGDVAGQPFVLDPWQQFIYWNVFGWKRCSDDKRRFSTAYVEVARKNGKSMLAAGTMGFLLSALENEAAAQCYAVATKEEQAKIVFQYFKEILKVSPEIRDLYEPSATSVYCPDTNSFFKALGSDSKTQDGFDPHAAVIDEYHEHKTDGMYNVMESGMVARTQPLIMVITTAGFNTAGPCYRMREAVVNILKGHYTDETTWGIIYTLDEEDKKEDNWHDPSVWIKANPGLGASVQLERMKQNLIKAVNEGSTKEANYKTKNLNIWLNAMELWEAAKVWSNCDHGPIDKDALRGKQCYGGLDIASNNDLTALALTFPVQPGVEIMTKLYFFFMPEDNVLKMQKKHRVDYTKWIEHEYIIPTPGNIIDKDYIRKHLNMLKGLYQIVNIHYDPWNLKNEAAVWAEEDELNLIELPQNINYMGPPTKDYETQIYGGLFNHGGNPVMNWQITQCEIYRDANENIKIMRKKENLKVDGPVADVMSTFGATEHKEPEKVPGFFVVKAKD